MFSAVAEHSHLLDLARSLGIAAYGLLFGLAAYSTYIAVKERRNAAKVRLHKMWSAVIFLSLGIALVALYGGTRRWQLLVEDAPLDLWRLVWSAAHTALLIAGLVLALRVQARVEEDERDEASQP